MKLAPVSVPQWKAWRVGGQPAVESVRPGIFSIPVPLPTVAVRYVLVYAFECADGLGLVDVGWDSDVAWTTLCAGIDSTGHHVSEVRWVVATHAHRDHYGLAARLRDQTGARFAMHPREADTLPARHGSAEHQRARYVDWMATCGVPVEKSAAMLPQSLIGSAPIPMPEPDLLLEDGDSVPFSGWDLRAVWTPGHTPGHLCYYESSNRLLLTGDHILPHITPNISFNPHQPANPLADYRRSLDRCQTLAVDEALPAHEYRFAELSQRINGLHAHHDERLEHMLEQVRARRGATSWQLSEAGDWSRPWAEIPPQSRRLALGETESHLANLAASGSVQPRSHGGAVRWWTGSDAPPGSEASS